jgi:hypothetical protein
MFQKPLLSIIVNDYIEPQGSLLFDFILISFQFLTGYGPIWEKQRPGCIRRRFPEIRVFWKGRPRLRNMVRQVIGRVISILPKIGGMLIRLFRKTGVRIRLRLKLSKIRILLRRSLRRWRGGMRRRGRGMWGRIRRGRIGWRKDNDPNNEKITQTFLVRVNFFE